MKVFTAALCSETNCFAPQPSDMSLFEARGLFNGPDRPAVMTEEFALPELARRRAARGEFELVEGPCAAAEPGGMVPQAVYETLRDRLLGRLEAAGPVDVVALALHGAMIAEDCDDCEGDLLRRVRALAPTAIIGVVLDPHAHVSTDMAAAADVIVAFKEYPHTDFEESANRVLDLSLAAARGDIRPTAALWDASVLAVFHTRRPSVAPLVGRMRELEADGAVLSASLIHSFPWGDSSSMGTRVYVLTDNAPDVAQSIAQALAQQAAEIAPDGMARPLDLDGALSQLPETPTKPTIWAESADNPGGGAGGDATFVLRYILERSIGPAALGYLFDPAAVEQAFALGVGATASFTVGGRSSPLAGAPVALEAEVMALEPKAFQTFAGATVSVGRAARLRHGDLDIVLISHRTQTLGPDLFDRLGVDLSQKRVVAVKSSRHYEAEFSGRASALITLDSPGVLDLDILGRPFRRLDRQRWPFIDPAPAPRRLWPPTSPPQHSPGDAPDAR
jgi:microcystin degradation protein MlrC